MKKEILITICLLFHCIYSFSQNAIINNNYITVNAGDTTTVNMISNNYDPDEGEYFKIKNIAYLNIAYIKYPSKTDSTVTFTSNFKLNANSYIVCNVNEIRNGTILKTYKDTLFVKAQNAKWADTLDVNNIKSLYSANSLLFYDGISGFPCFEAPKNSKKHCNFSSSLNFSGTDNDNKIRVSANESREQGDFYEGPIIINAYNAYPYIFNKKYARVWSISKEKIDFHIQNWNKPDYIIDEVIENWPANGDTTIGEMFRMAPFNDLNNNHIYEPQLGEYPLIKGDKSIYFIFNDKNGSQSITGGFGLGVEIHAMAYAFNTPNNKAINNTQFVEYSLYNRSNINYTNFIINMFDDFEIGYGWDDYSGCDTLLNMGYGYNANNVDQNYFNFPPAFGLLFLTHKLNAFVSVTNGSNLPNNELHFSNLFNGNFSNGNHIYYGGNGVWGNPNVTDQIVNKMYFGDLFDSTQWSEKSNNNTPSDERMYMSTPKKDNFAPNEKIQFDIAFIVAQDSSLNNFQNVNLLKQYAQSVKDFYKVIGKEEIAKTENKINIYPNPVNNLFYINFGNDKEYYNVNIYDIKGEILYSQKDVKNYANIDVSEFKQGIYIVHCFNKKYNFTNKIIKTIIY